MGKKFEEYDDVQDPKPMDKLYGMAAQHVTLDTQQTFQGIMQVVQQMVQAQQQYKPQPEMDASNQVLMQTSMAETQRRTQRDQAEMQLKGQESAARLQVEMAKLQQKQAIDMEEMQLRLAIATGDMNMKERIESARLTRDAARLSHDREKTAFDLINQGGQYGYQ